MMNYYHMLYKKCMGDYYCCFNSSCGPIVKHCHNVFSTFPTWNKCMLLWCDYLELILQVIKLHKDIKCGYQYYWYKTFEYCMNPLTYLFPVIDAVSLLIIEFWIDYVEIVSILRAFAIMPHIISYLIKTLVVIYCDIENHYEVLSFSRGPLFGLEFKSCWLCIIPEKLRP